MGRYFFQFLIPPPPNIQGKREKFTMTHLCAFCYQLPVEQYNCSLRSQCAFHSRYPTTCVVGENVLCMGRRSFNKNIRCELVSGYKWSTALLLR